MADRTVSVKLRADISDYTSKMAAAGAATRDVEKASADLQRAHAQEAAAAQKVRDAETELTKVRKDENASASDLVRAENKLASARADYQKTTVNTAAAQDKLTAAMAKAREEQNQSSDSFKLVRKDADDTGAALTKLAVGFGGLPIAAAAAGAATALALGGLPILFAGVGAALVANTAEVSTAWRELGTGLLDDARSWAQPLAAPIAQAADVIQTRLQVLAPVLAGIFQDSVPAVRIFTDAVTGLVTNALPGIGVAVAKSTQPLLGIEDLFTSLGNGITDFFVNLSAGAESSRGIMQTFGGILQDLLGFAGKLFADLSNNGGPALQGFRNGLSQLEGVILQLTQSGSALYPFISGFTGALSGGLGVLSSFVSILNALPSGFTSLTGSLLAVNKLAGLVGVTFTSGFKTAQQAMAQADLNGTSKFKAGLTGLTAGLLSPMNIALGVGGLALDLWGQKMQARAQEAQTFRKGVSDMTNALTQDGGALGKHTQALITNQLAQAKVYTSLRALGVGFDTVNAAATGNAQALGDVVSGTLRSVNALAAQGNTSESTRTQVAALTAEYLNGSITAEEYGSKLTGLDASVGGLSESQRLAIMSAAGLGKSVADTSKQLKEAQDIQDQMTRAASEQFRNMSAAEFAAQTASVQLAAAWQQLNQTGGDVVSQGKALIQVLHELSGQNMDVDEATQAMNDLLRDASQKFKQAASDGSKFSHAMIEANGAIDTTTETGSNLQDFLQSAADDMGSLAVAYKNAGVPADQINQKLSTQRDRIADTLKQWGLTPTEIQKVLDYYGLVPDKITTEVGLTGDQETQNQLTDIVTRLKSVPANVGVTVNALTAPAQKALTDLGYTIVELPDGTFQIFANTTEGQKAADDFVKKNDGARIVTKGEADMRAAIKSVGDFLTDVNGSSASPTIGAVTGPAYSGVGGFLNWTNGSGASPGIGANTGGAYTGVGNFLNWVRGSGANPNVGANVTGYSAVGSFLSWVSRQHANVTVGAIGSGALAVGRAMGGPITREDVPHFATGGIPHTRPGVLFGPGTGTSDSILLAASNGEYIEPAAATQRSRRLLDAIRNGQLTDDTAAKMAVLANSPAQIMPSQPTITVQAGGGQSVDPRLIGAAVATAVAEAMNGLGIKADGQTIARVVKKANAQLDRRK